MAQQRSALQDLQQQQKPKIKSHRKCRDVVFLVAFLGFWAGMIINSSFGYNKGDPRRLVYGLDYKGNHCGDKRAAPNLEDFDVRYWLNPNQVYESGLDKNPINLVEARSICLKACPSPSTNSTSISWVCDYPEGPVKLSMQQWEVRNYDYFDLLDQEQQASSKKLQGPCYPVLFRSTNLFWSCQFSTSASNESIQAWKSLNGTSVNQGDILAKAIHKALNAPSAIIKRYIADLGKAWPVLVVCGGIVPMLLSLFWLIIVRFFVGIMIWLTIATLNFAVILVALFCYIKAGWIGTDAVTAVIGEDAANSLSLDPSRGEKNHLKLAAVVVTAAVVLLVLATIILFKRLASAINILKVAAEAIGAVPSLIFYPVVPFLVLAVFYSYWISALLYLFSAGDVKQNDCHGSCCAYDLASQTTKCQGCCGYSMHHTRHIGWAILYHFFGCFWTTQFIIACCLTTVAGAIATYYWTPQDMGLFTVLSSAKRLVRYNLGSMALGSLIVATIEMVRFTLEVLRRKLKPVEAAPGGCAIRVFWCCVQGCLGCLKWTVEFINKNAYIVIAISGKGFCGAVGKAAKLVLSNALRITTVNIIAGIIVFMGKAAVSFSSALFAFLMLDSSSYKNSYRQKLSSPLLPVLFCWLLAYSIASVFFSVVEMAVNTIALSYCIDMADHNGAPLHAPTLLVETLGNGKGGGDLVL